MPVVKNSDLPTFERLIAENRPILPTDRAIHQDIRELHIGFLNMMPDGALEATERQWFRLISESNRVAQIHIHPFNLPVVERSADGKAHIEKFYESFDKIKEDGLDALIVTGANEETNPHVSQLDNWGPLKDVLGWAYENVTSTICSCIATTALMAHYYGEQPFWNDEKKIGIYSHKVLNKAHPLIRGMNTKFDAPHARSSEISKEQFEKAGFQSLVHSEEAGTYMAVSKDGFRQICIQGHPEYDTISLLKEYRRDVNWFRDGILKDYPVNPKNYFPQECDVILNVIKDRLLEGEKIDFPETELAEMIENTWADSARSLISSWIGHVYQITNVDRKKPFMDGVDPDNPLGI